MAKATIVVPTDPKEIQKINAFAKEIANALHRIDLENAAIKDILEVAKDSCDIPPATIKKLAAEYNKSSFHETSSKYETYLELYEKVFDVANISE